MVVWPLAADSNGKHVEQWIDAAVDEGYGSEKGVAGSGEVKDSTVIAVVACHTDHGVDDVRQPQDQVRDDDAGEETRRGATLEQRGTLQLPLHEQVHGRDGDE